MNQPTQTSEEWRVTDAQGRALHDIEQKRTPFPSLRSRTGGAQARMVQRMIDDKWIRSGPWRLLDRGAAALKAWQHKLIEREARFMRRGGRR